MSEKKRILLVGHCWPDSVGLRRAASKAASESEVKRVNTDDDLKREVAEADLLLVNRALDGRFETGDGVELIGRLGSAESAPPMMLVSDQSDAQQRAEAAGARPGFGKREVRSEKTIKKMRKALGVDASE